MPESYRRAVARQGREDGHSPDSRVSARARRGRAPATETSQGSACALRLTQATDCNGRRRRSSGASSLPDRTDARPMDSGHRDPGAENSPSAKEVELSSFARFAQHEDEQRKDESEGKTSSIERSDRGESKTIASFIQMAFDAYALCASSYYSEGLMRLFKRDSWFRTNNTTDFAHAVSRHVPGFIQGVEGLCIYEESPRPRSTPAVERPHRGEGWLRATVPEERQLCMPGRVPPALAPSRNGGRLPACPSLRARRRSRSPAREKCRWRSSRASWSPGRSGASSPARLHPRLRQMSGVSVRPHVRVSARHHAVGPRRPAA